MKSFGIYPGANFGDLNHFQDRRYLGAEAPYTPSGGPAAEAAKAFSMPHRPGHSPAPYDSSIGQEASLLRASRQANAGVSKVTGEARLTVELAGGLRPSKGVQNRGGLFKEIKVARGASPTTLASSEG
jgi:hypothetical protein